MVIFQDAEEVSQLAHLPNFAVWASSKKVLLANKPVTVKSEVAIVVGLNDLHNMEEIARMLCSYRAIRRHLQFNCIVGFDDSVIIKSSKPGSPREESRGFLSAVLTCCAGVCFVETSG
jgi:hypothetical protein